MSPGIFMRIMVWIVVATLLLAALGLYRGDFNILRWLVFVAGIALLYNVYRNRKVYWSLAFITAAILFNPIIPIYLRNVAVWRVLDFIVAVLFGFFLWQYYNVFRKGYQFESYLASLFPKDIWVIADKTRDFSKIFKRFVESDLNPDFTFRHIGTGKAFAVECKYRSYFFNGGIEWDKRKGENYREYGKRHGVPVYVAIGVGGHPKKPQRLFFCPLEKLNNSHYPIIREEELKPFERNPLEQIRSLPINPSTVLTGSNSRESRTRDGAGQE